MSSSISIGEGSSDSDHAQQVVAAVRRALEEVVDPCSIAAGAPIILADMGMIRSIVVNGDDVIVNLRPTSPFCSQLELIARKVEEVVNPVITGRCRVETDAADDWVPELMSDEARARLRAVRKR